MTAASSPCPHEATRCHSRGPHVSPPAAVERDAGSADRQRPQPRAGDPPEPGSVTRAGDPVISPRKGMWANPRASSAAHSDTQGDIQGDSWRLPAASATGGTGDPDGADRAASLIRAFAAAATRWPRSPGDLRPGRNPRGHRAPDDSCVPESPPAEPGPVMAALWASAWLLMLVRPALGEGQQTLAGDSASPVLNLKLDARKKLLTWRYSREVTQHSCRVVTPLAPATSTSPRVTADLAYRCAFPNALLHRGATLTLRGSSQGADFEEELVFPSAGDSGHPGPQRGGQQGARGAGPREGSRATGFSCIIYDVRFMNCSWTRGPAAPADVQYHLYSWFSRSGGQAWDGEGGKVSWGTFGSPGWAWKETRELGEAKTTDNYFFLLNGTSNEVAVQFLDFAPLVAFKIGKTGSQDNAPEVQ
ncbi:Hypothetical predicted protein [Marmota monax]|uniref:Uncharacterized protein n=1 Tax=Marmota monax TaxID=9995 RepID=A0A5E4CVE0_MARMO|nr:Hypothetical predicted protein [Marmota monax]